MPKTQITLASDEMRAALDVIKRLEKFAPDAQLRIIDAATNYLNPSARVRKGR